LYYADTIQERALALMGEKESASQALEGVFDTKALRILLNGGEDDSVLSALAKGLCGTESASSVWSRVGNRKGDDTCSSRLYGQTRRCDAKDTSVKATPCAITVDIQQMPSLFAASVEECSTMPENAPAISEFADLCEEGNLFSAMGQTSVAPQAPIIARST
jgi:hypothetical protein